VNLICRLVLSFTLLIAISQPSLAVQPLGQSRPSPAGAGTTNLIERGGTVTAIDQVKKIIIVDGVSYAFSARPVKVHSPSSKTPQNVMALKVGMQVRFSSFKGFGSGLDQVREIWVTSEGPE
jgi:hypothetical protein